MLVAHRLIVWQLCLLCNVFFGLLLLLRLHVSHHAHHLLHLRLECSQLGVGYGLNVIGSASLPRLSALARSGVIVSAEGVDVWRVARVEGEIVLKVSTVLGKSKSPFHFAEKVHILERICLKV